MSEVVKKTINEANYYIDNFSIKVWISRVINFLSILENLQKPVDLKLFTNVIRNISLNDELEKGPDQNPENTPASIPQKHLNRLLGLKTSFFKICRL